MILTRFTVIEGHIEQRNEFDTETLDATHLQSAKSVLDQLRAGQRQVRFSIDEDATCIVERGFGPVPFQERIPEMDGVRDKVEQEQREIIFTLAHDDPGRSGSNMFVVVGADFHNESGLFGAIGGSWAGEMLRQKRKRADVSIPKEQFKAAAAEVIAARPAYIEFGNLTDARRKLALYFASAVLLNP